MKKYFHIIFLIVIFTVGIIGHLITAFRPLMITLTPLTLSITAIWTFYFSYRKNNNHFIIWCTLTFLFTFVIEVIGVKTGLIFGNYSYGNSLGLKLFDVPLLIGINWLFVILGTIQLAQRISESKIIIALLTGAFASVFDYFLEPVAIKLDYWNWKNELIPIQNYIMWFMIGFILSYFYQILKIKTNRNTAEFYFIIQLIFFLLLRIFL